MKMTKLYIGINNPLGLRKIFTDVEEELLLMIKDVKEEVMNDSKELEELRKNKEELRTISQELVELKELLPEKPRVNLNIEKKVEEISKKVKEI